MPAGHDFFNPNGLKTVNTHELYITKHVFAAQLWLKAPYRKNHFTLYQAYYYRAGKHFPITENTQLCRRKCSGFSSSALTKAAFNLCPPR